MDKTDIEMLTKLRRRIFLTGISGGAAHLASCFSALEIIYTLYLKGIMRIDPQNVEMPDRDRFVLSKGHGALALYSVLCEVGYLTDSDLKTYLKPYSHVGGEPNMRDFKGIEASTGSLGHGLSVGLGMAIAQKMDKKGARTFVMIGDGESQEGSIWEAAMAASAFSLDNLIAILDCNGLQKTNSIEETMGIVNWEDKWEAFGWNVINVNGHDTDEIYESFIKLPRNQKPTLIIAHTIKGKGVSIMENNAIWHYKIPNRKEQKIFISELEINENDLEGL